MTACVWYTYTPGNSSWFKRIYQTFILQWTYSNGGTAFPNPWMRSPKHRENRFVYKRIRSFSSRISSFLSSKHIEFFQNLKLFQTRTNFLVYMLQNTYVASQCMHMKRHTLEKFLRNAWVRAGSGSSHVSFRFECWRALVWKSGALYAGGTSVAVSRTVSKSTSWSSKNKIMYESKFEQTKRRERLKNEARFCRPTSELRKHTSKSRIIEV